MPRSYTPKVSLKSLALNPLNNPLLESQHIRTRKRLVKSGIGQDLADIHTGEVIAVSAIHTIEEKDDAEFVKIFATGVAQAYELTRTAQRVFQIVLDQYQRTPMSKGYADYVNLLWFDNGIEGRDVGMSAYTFNRGLRELIDKTFLAAKDGVSFWINPSLFFKGDRVAFIKEYRRRKQSSSLSLES